MKLDELPFDVLFSILEKLQKRVSDQMTEIKLVNKTICNVADRITSRVVAVKLKDRATFQSQLHALRQRLEQRALFSIVTKFVFGGYRSCACRPNAVVSHDTGYFGVFDWRSEFDARFTEHYASENRTLACPAHLIDTSDIVWKDLADLLLCLPNLHDFTCACIHQVPSIVLAAIASKRTRSVSLQIRTFAVDDEDESPHSFLNPSESLARILSYRHLTKLRILVNDEVQPVDHPGDDHYDPFMSKELIYIALHAPQLEHIVIHTDSYCYKKDNVRKSVFEKVVSEAHVQPAKIVLKTIKTSGQSQSTEGLDLRIWQPLVDWSTLQTLTLMHETSTAMLRRLINIELPSLQDLKFASRLRDQQPEESPALLCRWLNRLPPLRRLAMHAYKDDALFNIIVERHGPTLETLNLLSTATLNYEHPFVFRRQHIEALVKHCQRLRKLSIAFARSGGNVDEATMYSLLGRLRDLRVLKLGLCVWPATCHPQLRDRNMDIRQQAQDDLDFTPAERNSFLYFRAFWGATRIINRGELRICLANLLVDEDLARSIYSCIHAYRPAHERKSLRLHLTHVASGADHTPQMVDRFVDKLIVILLREWIVGPGPLLRKTESGAEGQDEHAAEELYDFTRADDWAYYVFPVIDRMWPGLQARRVAMLEVAAKENTSGVPRNELKEKWYRDWLHEAPLRQLKSPPLQQPEMVDLSDG